MASPLSPQQRTIWIQDHQAGFPALFNVPSLFSIAGDLDIAAFRRALEEVVARHDMLRSRFFLSDGHPAQAVVEAPPLDFAIEYVQGEGARLAALDAQMQAPLDLVAGVPIRFRLFRLGKDRFQFLIVAHHLVWDAGSEAIFLHDLVEAFGRDAGAGGAAGQPGLSCLELGARQDAEAGQARKARLLERAAMDLEGLPAETGFAFPAPRKDISSFAGVFVRTRIGGRPLEAMATVAQGAGVTLYMLLLCVFRVLIAKMGRRNDFLIATPMSLRTDMRSLSIIGYLTNVTAVRNALDPAKSFLEALEAEKAGVLSAMQRREIPLHECLASGSAGHAQAGGPPVTVSFSYNRTSEQPWSLGAASLAPIPLTAGVTQFDIAADVTMTETGLDLLWACRRSLFATTDADRLAARYAALLASIVELPDLPIGAIDVATADDKAAFAMNEHYDPVPDRTPLDMFLLWANRAPDAPAVRQGDVKLSYGELLAAARHVAAALAGQPFPLESSVALLMERSVYLPAAILGVALAGHAVVPLDPAYPPERLKAVIQHAGVVAVVIGTTPPPLDLGKRFVVAIGQGVRLAAAEAVPSPPRADALAYVLYTSGSTGSPKGVAIAHRSVANCLAAASDLLGCLPGQLTLSSTTIAFDIAAFEILLPLISGGVLVITDADMRNGSHVRAMMERHRPDYFQGTPAVWKLLFAAGWTGQPGLVGLIGGDTVAPQLAATIRACTAHLWHTYGPTETTLFTLAEEVSDTRGPILPVGVPLSGTRAYVLDERLGRCLPGTIGELYIGGAGLARGYIRMARETAERFIPNPFARNAGERLYRTGDLALVRTDGRIAILGRTDRQLKIRGFRIEPEEVERTLARVDGIADCAVVVIDRNSDKARLVACLERAPAFAGSDKILGAIARARAAELMPHYMVPTAFLVYDALPLGPTGKIDRAKLLGDALAAVAPPGASPPRFASELERTVARVWGDVLGGVQCGPGSDFLALGGSSIAATLAVGLLREAIGVRVDAISFFLKPRFEDFMGEVDREIGRARFFAARVAREAEAHG